MSKTQEEACETNGSQYFLVDSKVLPESFLKVVKAKQLLAQGKVKNLSDATKAVGISRSVFYRYRNCIFTYHNISANQIATLTAELVDEPGVLSAVLGILSDRGANILTINQNIPVDGVAPISVSMRIEKLNMTIPELTAEVDCLSGVVGARILSS